MWSMVSIAVDLLICICKLTLPFCSCGSACVSSLDRFTNFGNIINQCIQWVDNFNTEPRCCTDLCCITGSYCFLHVEENTG